jgi:hypothetical protein
MYVEGRRHCSTIGGLVGGLENSFEMEQDCRQNSEIPGSIKASKAAETHENQSLSVKVDAASCKSVGRGNRM